MCKCCSDTNKLLTFCVCDARSINGVKRYTEMERNCSVDLMFIGPCIIVIAEE